MQSLTVHFRCAKGSFQPEFLARISAVADEYGVVIDPEPKKIMNEDERRRSMEEFKLRAAEISKSIGPVDTDGAQSLRSLRDSI